jgi:plastocyanin
MDPVTWHRRLSTARWVAFGLTAAVGLIATGCTEKPPTEPDPPTQTNTITITAAGVSPKNIEVPIGSRVRFVNNDSRSHYMHSDPHPDQTDCPELNQVGFLAPSQVRESGNLVVARTCGYHDHDLFNDATLRGTITIR